MMAQRPLASRNDQAWVVLPSSQRSQAARKRYRPERPNQLNARP